MVVDIFYMMDYILIQEVKSFGLITFHHVWVICILVKIINVNNKENILDSVMESCSYIAIAQTLQWIATYYVVSDIQPSEGYGASIRLCSLDGWIFVLYRELIDLYQEKTKNFEKYKIFNYNTIKYRGILYRKCYNN